MHTNTNITLVPRFERFIAQQINKGRYASPSEAVNAGLSLLEEHEKKLNTLRRALKDGEESGVAERFSLEDVICELDNERAH